jgi:hypothetical protein
VADYETIPFAEAIARFGLETKFDEYKLEAYAEGGRARRLAPSSGRSSSPKRAS